MCVLTVFFLFLGELSRQLFDAYKNDPEMARVDAFICNHPVATCQLYMPFNKSIIMLSTTRYEHGQENPNQWQNFNRNIQRIAAKPKHFVAGNSMYDAEYIEYFTGVKAEYVPS